MLRQIPKDAIPAWAPAVPRRLRNVLQTSPGPRNLGLVLTALSVGAVLVGMACASCLTLSLQRTQLLASAQADSLRLSNVLQTTLEAAMLHGDSRLVEEMLQAVATPSGLERVRILGGAGQVMASSLPGEVGQSLALSDPICVNCHTQGQAHSASVPMSKITGAALLNASLIPNGVECQACHNPQQPTLGHLLVESPLADLQRQLKASLLRLLISTAAAFGLLVVALVPALRALIIRPVQMLTRVAVQIGTGNLDEPVALGRSDELGQLAAALNDMRKQLAAGRLNLERRNAELSMLNEVAHAASEVLDPQQLLQLGIRLVVDTPGIAAGALFLVDQECGRFMQRAAWGLSEAQCVEMACRLQAILRSRRSRSAQGEVLAFADVAADACGSGLPAGNQQAFWISLPLMSHGSEIGRMALITQPGHRLTEEGTNILRAMCEEIGLALDHAIHYQRAQSAGAASERELLAREMHDSLAQTLGYLKMEASITEQLLSEGAIGKAQEHLRDVKEIAGSTYTDVREVIFGLRHPGAPETDFLTDLETYLVDYRTHYGLDVQLHRVNGYQPVFSPTVSRQVTRIVQEALVNVRKHADVPSAVIRIDQADSAWRITIEDGGRGFDPHSVHAEGSHFLGLQIMRDRAESIGAGLDIEARPGEGTRLTLKVPLEDHGDTLASH